MKRGRRGTLLWLGASAATLVLLTFTWLSEGRADVGEDGVSVGVLTRAVLSLTEALGAQKETPSAVACYDDDRAVVLLEDAADRKPKISSRMHPTQNFPDDGGSGGGGGGGLPDVLEGADPPIPGSIFFHETSCRGGGSEGRLELDSRQSCAIESAALNNPGLQVYVLMTSPAVKNWSAWSPSARELLAYPNVHFRHLNVERYLHGTPLETLYTSGALRRSYWPVSHTSDALRYLTLWRYGGTYLDLDVVLIKSLEGKSNFAGAESSADVAVGVLNLGNDRLGRRVANECINDIKNNFRGDIWGNNGPGVMTRVLKRLCGVREPTKMTAEKCSGFTVYPPYAFYPVTWNQWKLYFEESSSSSTMELLTDSIAIHVWNKLSKMELIKFGSKQPYGLIAEKHCPRVYKQSAPYF